MSLSNNNNSALWNWLRGMLPVFGKGYPKVDINSGGAPSQAEQRELFTVALATATGSGAIAESFLVTATSTITVVVAFKSGGDAVKPATSEDCVVLIDSAAGADFDHVIGRKDPSLGTDTGDLVFGNFPEIVRDADAIRVEYPNSDGNNWIVAVTLGVPS